MPAKITAQLAKEIRRNTSEEHLEAINVSLSLLNEELGMLSRQDLSPVLKTAIETLWPNLNLPEELNRINKKIDGLVETFTKKTPDTEVPV